MYIYLKKIQQLIFLFLETWYLYLAQKIHYQL